jgi:hypothetical protein
MKLRLHKIMKKLLKSSIISILIIGIVAVSVIISLHLLLLGLTNIL